jgi:hypothetical protein
MRALIDSSGWPEALAYYGMFPHEFSASPDLDFHIDQTVGITSINLEKVLDEVLEVSEAGENEVFLATHGTVEEGNPGGLSMPLTAGCDVDAMRDEVRVLANAAIALREVDSDPLGWVRFIENEADRRRVQAGANPEQGPDLLGQWLDSQAESLHMSKDRLRRIASKRNQLAARRLKRIEIRACNLGAFPEAMSSLREFFGVETLLAPKVTAMCGRLRMHILEDPNQYQEWVHAHGEAGVENAFAEMDSAAGRSFGEAVCFRIRETSPGSYLFELEGAARSEEAVQSWVETYIMPGSSYSGHGMLRVAALWTFGRPGLPQPYVLPGEQDYRNLIASEPM